MSATITDLFCGAGGSSIGAAAAGAEIVMAANHWSTAIEVHQANHPDTRHDCADISQADPRRYPRTDILLASPECTNHSQAKGVSRRKQNPDLFDQDFDPAAERSRATMWDVPRFAEQNDYSAIVVENVVEATKWVGWRGWCVTMDDLGYEQRIVCHNSMHHGVPQSRDRIYIVFTKRGLRPGLELELTGWCDTCDAMRPCRQSWKNGRTVGRYGPQYTYRCTTCRGQVTPATEPAASIIDFDLPCPLIGERARPLAAKTRARISAGLQRHGFAPIVTAGAGNTYETSPGNRSRPLTEPLPTQTTTAQTALVVPMRNHGVPYPATDPLGTVTAGGMHHGLLMRNNTTRGDQGVMTTTLDEPARTMTTVGSQSLLMPYYGTGDCQPADRPIGTIPTRDRWALIDPDEAIDACGFRMLEPYEVAAAMAFPTGYIPRNLSKKDQVKLAGNAVTPPVMTWIVGRIIQAMEAAA